MVIKNTDYGNDVVMAQFFLSCKIDWETKHLF